jgi:TonB dependent receptor
MADFLLLPTTNIASGQYAQPGVNALSTGSISGSNAIGHVLGGVNGYNGDNIAKSTYHAPYFAAYATDSWKITPRLTATLGMRYEYFGPYSSLGGQEANFWMGEGGNEATNSAFYVAHDGCATTMSSYFIGLLAYDNIPIVCQPGNTANEMPKANWAPRLGIAYRIRPNLVARVGGGIAYGAFDSVGYGGTLGTNYPFEVSEQQGPNSPYTPQLLSNSGNSNVTATMENTFGLVNMDNAVNQYIQVGSLALYGKSYHFKVPYITTLDFALQWQFRNHDSIQATYVGNLGKQLESAEPYHNGARQLLTSGTPAVTIPSPINPANPYAASSPLMPDGTFTIPFPNLAPNSEIENTEMLSNYESGRVEYMHSFAAGFNMDANYTFASCLSDTQGGQQNEGGPGNGRAPWVVGFGGYRADYDRCENTSRQIFKASGEFGLPFGRGAYWARNANVFEDAVIGGWKLDPIWISASGLLANVSCQGTNGYGANPSFNGPWFQTGSTDFNCNAPLVPGQPLNGPGPKDHARTRITGYWNSSAFTAPQLGVQTNGQQDFLPLGIRGNQIYGPGWYDFDLSTHKYFKVNETVKFEVVAEAFNVFNHVELTNPSTSGYTDPSEETLTSGFGTITGDRNGARTWEFAGKFYF